MRMSCNGCRVLRKGCSENCSIRPCLQWIKSHDSQANATVFLAKFYGRAGLMNLINAGPEHLRPAIFRSLLYEACGRIVNPFYGSVGLLWSGSWELCQAAVEAVLKGAPITPITSEAAANGHGLPLNPHDIRHVSKDVNSTASDRLRRGKTRCRLHRSVRKPKPSKDSRKGSVVDRVGDFFPDQIIRSTSHESSLSHQSDSAPNVENESKESECIVSVETADASAPAMIRSETDSFPKRKYEAIEEGDVALELTLGLKPPMSCATHVVPMKKRRVDHSPTGACKTELGLDLQVYKQSPR